MTRFKAVLLAELSKTTTNCADEIYEMIDIIAVAIGAASKSHGDLLDGVDKVHSAIREIAANTFIKKEKKHGRS